MRGPVSARRVFQAAAGGDQRAIAVVADAVRRLRDGNAQGLAEWEEFAKDRWSRALGQKD